MILEAIRKDLNTTQSTAEGLRKSLGKAPLIPDAPETAAQTHAMLRAKAGFDIRQMVSEYRALRASVLRLFLAEGRILTEEVNADLLRFNEAIVDPRRWPSRSVISALSPSAGARFSWPFSVTIFEDPSMPFSSPPSC
jgi:hypothetical protein